MSKYITKTERARPLANDMSNPRRLRLEKEGRFSPHTLAWDREEFSPDPPDLAPVPQHVPVEWQASPWPGNTVDIKVDNTISL